ncbi:MAG: Holliday junction branch migration protein RuvA [Aquificae bacterium]|nr:Holliday junction branch migration protein RuvA [Aquificota bacterium]
MIDFLEGETVYSTENFCVLKIGSYGIKILTPYKVEGKVKLFTKLYIKEDEPVLYGFKTQEERNLFEKLISISGIGIKHAFSLIKHLSYSNFIKAIEEKDISLLSSVPGIGKKTAQRLILELQGKIDFEENEKDSLLKDATEALIQLGFEKKEIQKALKEVMKKEKLTSVQELIKKTLILLSK